MSNEQLKKMQKELDQTRAKLHEKNREVISLLDAQKKLNESNDEISELKKRLTEDVDKAKTESTIRAKEQIEELRKEVASLKVENESLRSNYSLAIEQKALAEQKATQAEAHMKQMAAEHTQTLPEPVKTYRKDRIRKSRR